MSGEQHTHGHDVGERLYIHRHTAIHELPAHVKLLSTFSFVLVVVLTPVDQYELFGIYALMLAGLVAIAKIPFRSLALRTAIEIPFVLFALLLPFVIPGPRVEWFGVGLSQAGLEQAFGILAKGTIGVVATIILAASTQAHELLRGLERLRVPATIVQIATFMLRYANVVTDEMSRMKVARESRAFDARGVRSWPILGQSAGALFIRSYERGERVHLAMLARGFDGTFFRADRKPVTAGQWMQAASVPAVALVALLSALLIRGL